MNKTLSGKRYIGRKSKAKGNGFPRVFACANCGVLSETERSHTITCSNACRVALHRHPDRLAHWQKFADLGEITVQDLLDAHAAARLLTKEQLDQIEFDESSMDAMRGRVYRAYVSAVFDAAGGDA